MECICWHFRVRHHAWARVWAGNVSSIQVNPEDLMLISRPLCVYRLGSKGMFQSNGPGVGPHHFCEVAQTNDTQYKNTTQLPSDQCGFYNRTLVLRACVHCILKNCYWYFSNQCLEGMAHYQQHL